MNCSRPLPIRGFVGSLSALLLLLLLLLQITVGFCLLAYGYMPVPALAARYLLNRNLPDNISAQVEFVRLYGNGRLYCSDLTFSLENENEVLFETRQVELQFRWLGPSRPPEISGIALSGGTLYQPAILTEDGRAKQLLEKVALKMKNENSGNWRVDRVGALHGEIRLWGAFNLPIQHRELSSVTPSETIRDLYGRIGELLFFSEEVKRFDQPTVSFSIEQTTEDYSKISIHASSPRMTDETFNAEAIEIYGDFLWGDDTIIAQRPIRMKVGSLLLKRFQLEAENAELLIPLNSVAEILSGNWPSFWITASKLSAVGVALEAPNLSIKATEFPVVQFDGTTLKDEEILNLQGSLNTADLSASIFARGYLDLSNLWPTEIGRQMPLLVTTGRPYFELLVEFEEQMKLSQGSASASFKNLMLGELTIDWGRAQGRFQDGKYFVDSVQLKRDAQWLDLEFDFELSNLEYRIALRGSIDPKQYSHLLPNWWGNLFNDFDFSQADFSHGDFVIFGNAGAKVADFYFGHVEARGVDYRGIHLSDGAIKIQGWGPKTHLKLINVESGPEVASGDLIFESRLDTVKGPATVGLNINANLSIENAKRLFNDKTAAIIGDFQTDALTDIRLQAQIFNQSYPEFSERGHFELLANNPNPVTYRSVPLDHLRFRLSQRDRLLHLRDTQFGYAGGRGAAMTDIHTTESNSHILTYEIELIDTIRQDAFEKFPQIEDFQNSFQTRSVERAEVKEPGGSQGRFDLKLRGQGPANDPWGHAGHGFFELRNDHFATIQLLGPLSKLLQNTELNFTSLGLDQMRGAFRFKDELIDFSTLRVDGAHAQIRSPGTFNLRSQSLDMRLSVFLFGNTSGPVSRIRRFGNFITSPLPNLLEFEVTGTLTDQKFRSVYDPRNLIPNL